MNYMLFLDGDNETDTPYSKGKNIIVFMSLMMLHYRTSMWQYYLSFAV